MKQKLVKIIEIILTIIAVILMLLAVYNFGKQKAYTEMTREIYNNITQSY